MFSGCLSTAKCLGLSSIEVLAKIEDLCIKISYFSIGNNVLEDDGRVNQLSSDKGCQLDTFNVKRTPSHVLGQNDIKGQRSNTL